MTRPGRGRKRAVRLAGNGTGRGEAGLDVPAPWAKGRTDRVTMRVSDTIRLMRAKGSIGDGEVRAAGWLRAVIEAAESGGAKAMDPTLVKVDTSLAGGGEPAWSVAHAMAQRDAVRRRVGELVWSVLRAVVYEGRALIEVDGPEDRKAIGYILRKGLEDVDAAFCGHLNPALGR